MHPAIGEDDPVVIWGGGTWDWLDPVTVIQAFSHVVREVPDAKLYFLGMQLSTPNVAQMEMVDRAVNTARDLKLEGTSVIFGDWAPYDLREAYLLEADVAVIAARDVAEARLAFRTRALDYFWAGLPVVTTAGDVLADVVTSERIGEVVPPGDVDAFVAALLKLLKNPGLRAECARNGLRVAERYRWPVAVEPLRRVAREPWRWRGARNLAAHDDAHRGDAAAAGAHAPPAARARPPARLRRHVGGVARPRPASPRPPPQDAGLSGVQGRTADPSLGRRRSTGSDHAVLRGVTTLRATPAIPARAREGQRRRG